MEYFALETALGIPFLLTAIARISVSPSDCGELHRRPGGGADHCPARRLQRVPGRRGQLLDLCQGGGAGRAPGNAGPVRRRVGGDSPGHGGGRPADHRGRHRRVRHRRGGPGPG